MSTSEERPATRRRAGLLALSGALAAVLLTLAVTGTLSSWTAAIIGNDDNTADSAGAVVLEESGPGGVTCTTASSATNTATCSSINKYGDAGAAATGATALQPGDTVSTTVTLTNTGPSDAATFTLTPGTCASVYHSGSRQGQTPLAADDLCSQLSVGAECVAGATSVLSVAPVALASFTGARTITGGLASGDAVDCTFTVALASGSGARFSGQRVEQDLTWQISV